MSKPPRVRSEHQKEFVKIFNTFRNRHTPWSVWSDFVTMAACSLSMIDEAQKDKRSRLYDETAKKYTAEDLNRFAEMFAVLVVALEEDPDQDFLGELYSLLELANTHNGQFFTPYNVCVMMAKMSAGNMPAEVAEKGVVSVNDCCCGAGALLIALANEARRQGVNFQRHIEFVAQDIDFTAAMMCYIQLSLLGCPGYVIVGNTLSTPPTELLTNQNVWYTPLYFHEIWHWRRVITALNRMTEPAPSITTPKEENQKNKAPGGAQPPEELKQLSLFD